LKPALEVEDLRFSYPGGPEILHGVSFTVESGERTCILGANGAGKSTLAWCLSGILKGTSAIRVFGENVGASRSKIGVVFQNPEDQLFMPTLLQDLTLPLINKGMERERTETKARAILRDAELAHCASKPASQLSLGQRKRAAIAAALITDPEILLLDEPTAELDGRATRMLCESLLRLQKTILAVTHDMDFIRRVASQVLVLSEGAILAGGTTDILNDTELLGRARLL
jgi:cobalt/nickel transport system ATP-binding protein